MVDRSIIEEIITKTIVSIKCPATEKARKIGDSCIVSEEENDTGYDDHIFSYEDGTTIIFDDDFNLKNISFDGKSYDYYGEDSYDEFNYQKETLMNTFDGEEPTDFQKEVGIMDWDYLLDFADDFASVHGWMINNELRKGVDIDSDSYDNSWLNDADALLDHDWFVNVENKTLCDHGDYCALRITTSIHDNENLRKRIVSDKAHYSTSTGAEMMELLREFGNGIEYNPYKDAVTMDNFKDSWKTITLVKKGSGVHGVFLGTALNEGRHADSEFISDWESELNFPPNTKFERLIIDESNKIIIQTPQVKT